MKTISASLLLAVVAFMGSAAAAPSAAALRGNRNLVADVEVKSIATCGRSGCSNPSGMTQAANPGDTFSVRCCFDEDAVIQNNVSGGKRTAGCDVLSASTIGACNNGKTKEEAKAICVSGGGRLCTSTEMLDGCGFGTGCNFDNKWLWTEGELAVRASADQTFGQHAAVCGDPTQVNPSACLVGAKFYASIGADDEEEHEVRCCSDTPPTFGTKNVNHSQCQNVHAFSEAPTSGGTNAIECIPPTTFWEAESICSFNGGRLCTVEEVLLGCTTQSGCNYDNHHVWTSTPSCPTDTDCAVEFVPSDSPFFVEVAEQSSVQSGEFLPPAVRASAVPTSGQHAAACGDPTNFAAEGCAVEGTFYPSIGADDEEEHEVRCCSDTPPTFGTKNVNHSQCQNVHAFSEAPTSGGTNAIECIPPTTFWEAESICSFNGGRLCTVEEVLLGCTTQSGCNYDNHHVWTSTPSCPTDTDCAVEFVPSDSLFFVEVAEQSFVQSVGGTSIAVCGKEGKCSNPSGMTQAANPADLYGVRCCFDNEDEIKKDKVSTVTDIQGCSVYASSNIMFENESCHYKQTKEQAQAICVSGGGRLCTSTEMLNQCTIGSGCNQDFNWVWTEGVYQPPAVRAPADETSGQHALVCGDPTKFGAEGCAVEGTFYPSISAADEEEHEVRCCSDKPLTFGGTKNHAQCSVHGFSMVPNSEGNKIECIPPATFWEAESICDFNGGRLCTDGEVLLGCTTLSGCNYDNHHVWTSTPSCATKDECDREEHTEDYEGCYSDKSVGHLLNFRFGAGYSIKRCFESCRTAGYAYAGLRNAGTCFCGSKTTPDSLQDNSVCNKPCVSGSGMCGGTTSLSLFKTTIEGSEVDNYEKWYRGCVTDPDNFMEVDMGTTTLKECVDACTTEGYALASLRNGGDCHCGSSRPPARSADCDMACANEMGICGGTKGGISLYQTTENKQPLKTLLQCKGALSTYWGDPHITSFDNVKYGCQGVGHFIMTKSKDYVLQSTFKQAIGRYSSASVVSGIAVQYKDHPVIQISVANEKGTDFPEVNDLTEEMQDCQVNVFVGRKQLSHSDFGTKSGDVDIQIKTNGFDIQFPAEADSLAQGPAIVVKVRKGVAGCLIDVNTCVSENLMNTTIGLLGTPNGLRTDEWMDRNGTTLKFLTSKKDNTEYCTKEWCVRDPDESLFTYVEGHDFADFDHCYKHFVAPETDLVPNPEVEAACEFVPETKAECMFDLSIITTATTLGGEDTIGTLKNLTNEVQAMGEFQLTTENEHFVHEEREDPDCPEDVKLVDTIGPDFDNLPVRIHSFHDDKSKVTVEILSPLLSTQKVEKLYVSYTDGSGPSKCVGFGESDFFFSSLIDVSCMKSSPVAIVHFFAVDSSVYGAEQVNMTVIPDCCHDESPSLPAVQYTFTVMCESQCPENVSR